MLGDLTESRLREMFALRDARAMLLVGSRADGLDYPGSDIDYLAVYDQEGRIPDVIGLPDAIRSDSSLGRNWIGELGGDEVNVECVTLATLRRLASIVQAPVDARRSGVLQPLEMRLLSRLATGRPVGASATGADLVGHASLVRLPAVALTMNYFGVASYLELARGTDAGDDALRAETSLLMVAIGLGVAALALHDVVVSAPKKIGLALRHLERDGRDLAVRQAELRALISPHEDVAARLRAADAALHRIRRAVAARGRAEGGAWTEVTGAVAGPTFIDEEEKR